MMMTLPEVTDCRRILLSQNPPDASSLPCAADRDLFEMHPEIEQKRAEMADAIDLDDTHDRFVRQPITVVYIPRRRQGG
ncbi:MAG TPA: hypothetical protein VHV31_01735 [Nitrolancea sp.]|jgi:hypothetical protein|nr:hypothetical protein [Nitrolancea sp.]